MEGLGITRTPTPNSNSYPYTYPYSNRYFRYYFNPDGGKPSIQIIALGEDRDIWTAMCTSAENFIESFTEQTIQGIDQQAFKTKLEYGKKIKSQF